MSAKNDYLDRLERFVDWLEMKRKQAGLTQEQLAREGGVSTSSYTKTASLRRNRQRDGDGSKKVFYPRSPDFFDGVLTALGEKIGEDCLSAGRKFFANGNGNGTAPCPPGQNPNEDLVRLLLKLQNLSPEKRRLVEELMDHLTITS